MPSTSRRDSGFTLMEMMVVIVVMGLMLMLVIGRGPAHSNTLSLRAETSDLVQALRLTRTQAIATGRAIPFVIDPAQRAFGPPGRLRVISPGIVLSASKPAILFQPDGSASDGTIRLALHRMRMVVQVHWLDGRVSVGRLQAG